MVDIDYLGPLRLSAGNQNIFLISDQFTKLHEAVELPDQSAPTTAKPSAHYWITHFGCPESFHSDQRCNFEAKLFTNVTELLQLDKTRLIAFHLQSNDAIETTNHMLPNTMAKTTDINQRNWCELLPYVLLACRNFVHESTGYARFSLLFEQEVTLQLDLQVPHPHRNYLEKLL